MNRLVKTSFVAVVIVFSLSLVNIEHIFDYPFSNTDYYWHYYHFFIGRAANISLIDYSHYSPYFMAGYPTLIPPSNGIFVLIARLCEDIGLVKVFNASVLAAMVLSPIILAISVRLTRLVPKGQEVLLFMFLSLYLLKTFFFIDIGMFSYALMVCLWVMITIRVNALIESPLVKAIDVVWIALLSALAIMVHQYAIILLFPGLLFFFLMQVGRPRSLVVNGLVFLAIVSAINAFWLYPRLKYGHWLSGFPASELGGLSIAAYMKNLSYYVTVFFIPITFGAAWLSYRRSLFSATQIGYLLSVYCSLTILGLGAHWGPIEGLDATRAREVGLYISALLFASLLASSGIFQFLSSRTLSVVMNVSLIGALAVFSWYSAVNRYVSIGPEPVEETQVGRLADFLSDNGVTPSARILVEARALKGSEVRSGNMSGLPLTFSRAMLPLLIGTEVIGGPYNHPRSLKNNFADYTTGYLFKRKIQDLSIEDFLRYANLYNIRWMVPITEESREFVDRNTRSFKKIAHSTEVFRVLDLTLYEIIGLERGSFFLEGEGKLVAQVDEIRITEAKGKKLVLKYHWFDTAESQTPGVTVRPTTIAGLPVPLIEIDNPSNLKDIRIGF